MPLSWSLCPRKGAGDFLIAADKGYEALEAEGYLCSIPGKGSFAAPHTGVDGRRREELLEVFDQTTAELLFLGVTGDALRTRIGTKEGGCVQ